MLAEPRTIARRRGSRYRQRLDPIAALRSMPDRSSSMVFRSPAAARLLLTVLLAVATPHALAQETYPARPLRIIVSIPAGSGTDTVARLIANGLSERLGRQVIVDNRPGAGTIIGNDMVAKAKPDGYTLLMNGAAFTISPAIYKKI